LHGGESFTIYGGAAPSRPTLIRLTSKLPSAALPVAGAANGAPGLIARG
jgi:hypothetical protein